MTYEGNPYAIAFSFAITVEGLRVDGTFVQWLVQQTGAVAIAGLALWLLDRSYRDALRREKETIEQGREDRRQLITVIAENAKSHTSLQATIENMTREWSRNSRGGLAASDD